MTGLLVCTPASGRPVRSCWDPWPEILDFQVYPDKSIEPPPEPLPLRYNLDAIWGNGPASGTPEDFANAPKPAPDDATRLQNLLYSVPSYVNGGRTAAFPAGNPPVPYAVQSVTTVIPADYDGTFIPSSSLRTVTPPDEAAQLDAVTKTDKDVPEDKIWTPPWSVVKGV